MRGVCLRFGLLEKCRIRLLWDHSVGQRAENPLEGHGDKRGGEQVMALATPSAQRPEDAK
jgi:hypothetical protein